MNNIPVRKCVSCGIKAQKENFIMVLKSPKSQKDVTFTVLRGGNKPSGRAAYICINEKCLEKAKKNRRFEKIFRMKINSNIYELIEKEIKNYER